MIITGKPFTTAILSRLRNSIDVIRGQIKQDPKIAIIQVGNNSASTLFVRNKLRVANDLDISTQVHNLPQNTTQEQLIEIIKFHNMNPNTHSIVVQLPLPLHINARTVLSTIEFSKDVDGLHHDQVGKLITNKNIIYPCTAFGVMYLLRQLNVQFKQKKICVVGKSNLVGLPLSLMLMQENATVDVCHQFTKELPEHTKNADILIAVCGKPNLIKKNYVHSNQIVIDVGINKINGKIIGDVDYQNVKNHVKMITKVPGGIGPLTVTMLILQHGLPQDHSILNI